MSNHELWRLSADELSPLTRSGEIRPSEAVASALARMDAVNPALNAVVEDLRDEALARAEVLDSTPEAARGPLHGVPVTIKINVDQTGHATSNGIPALKDLIAPDDAPVVQNLERAGAVVIGRTNTPEFSFRADTDN
ncbi:MAG: amidase, partial [Tritonibacter mobilis]|nr:amidase [Tritonibacter mobilis]